MQHSNHYINRLTYHLNRLHDDNGKHLYGPNTHVRHVLNRMVDDDEMQEKAAIRALEIVVNSLNSGKGKKDKNKRGSMTDICYKIGQSLGYISGYSPDDPPKVDDSGIAQMGMKVIDWFCQEGWLTLNKFKLPKGKHWQWHVIPSTEFVAYCSEHVRTTELPSITAGAFVWNKPYLMFNNSPMEFVKKSLLHRVTNWYYPDDIPDVYKAINRLNAQTWKVNQHMLNLMNTMTDDNPFQPESISLEQAEAARIELRNMTRRAKKYELFMLEKVLNDSDMEEASKMRIIDKKFDALVEREGKVHRNVLSLHSKQTKFYQVTKLANEVQGEALNFCYNMSSIGRVFCLQPYLNPLEEDSAKALLQFYQSYPVDLTELAICTSNAFGHDKLLMDDRIDWVNNNMEMLIAVGKDPWANMHLLLDDEGQLILGKKEKWQALMLANVWHKYDEWVNTLNQDPDTFRSAIPCGYDATNSGLQILSIIGRDEFCGPMVNLTTAYDEDGNQMVGDAYKFIAGFLPDAIDNTDEDKLSNTLIALANRLREEPKLGRTVVKRNVMTKNYDSQPWGMGTQHIEDKTTYGFKEANELTDGDCRVLGFINYGLTAEHFKRPNDLMVWLKEGIDLMPATAGPIVWWTMPDGFRAFFVKPKYKRVQARGKVAGQRVNLNLVLPLNELNRKDAKQAISPLRIHAEDAAILRRIVNAMPEEAPFGTIHDKFLTTSSFLPYLLEAGKGAYLITADREFFKESMTLCFGVDRELPEAGTLDPEDIRESEYFLS